MRRSERISIEIALMTLHDLTARKSEDRFRRLFDSNLVAIAFWDSRDRIVEANDAYLSIIGYTREDFTPGTISWRGLTPPEYQTLDDAALLEANSHTVSKVYEKEYLRKDGKRTPVVIGVGGLNNSRYEGLAFALDISERRRMEAHLLRSQKLESMSVLAGGIAHDFNNLLMGIVANVSLMLDEADPGSSLENLGGNVLAATEQAANLTRQMLVYSGRGQFTAGPLSVSKQVENISSLIKASIPKGIQLRLNVAHDVRLIHADAGQVQQLVMNLVLNGAEAIGLRGVITISVSAVEIGEESSSNLAGGALLPGNYILLEVGDTGKGMDEATKARIFDPFFTTKCVGRGLGLAAVLGIVRGHHGGIAVSSELGKGTNVQVFLPVEQVGFTLQAKM